MSLFLIIRPDQEKNNPLCDLSALAVHLILTARFAQDAKSAKKSMSLLSARKT